MAGVKIGQKMSLENVVVKGKRVLIRVDFNVPMIGTTITSNQRIEAALPTINYCLNNEAKAVVLMSHLGRPDGKVNMKYSLKPVADELQKLLNKNVTFLSDCVGSAVEQDVENAEFGSVILLENVRFYPEEEINSLDLEKKVITNESVSNFRKSLRKLGDIYVNDAFGTAHRFHSTMVGIDLPIKCSGFLMKKELEYFSKVLEEPKRPLTAIIGGAKVSDKILLIKNFLDKVDNIIIGGAMAFTFLKIQHNMKIGKSLFDEKGSHVIEEITNLSKEKNVKMLLPIDFVVAEDKTATAQTSIVTLEEGISDNLTGFDIGPKSAKLFEETILKSQTIIWNGPMGVFEVDQFGKGTKSVLDALVRASKEFNAITVVGGGDSASACLKYNVENQLSHISTGGGASMELLEGKELPGVIALSDQK